MGVSGRDFVQCRCVLYNITTPMYRLYINDGDEESEDEE